MKKTNQKSALRGLLTRLKPYTPHIIFTLLLAIATVVLSLYIPILVGEAIDHILGKGQVHFSKIFDIFLKIALAAGLTALLQWVMNTLNNKITYQVIEDVRQEAIRKLQRLPVSYLHAHSSGDIVSRMIADVDQFADGLLLGFTQLFTGLVTILVTLIFMLTIHPWITLLVVLLTPLSLLMARFIANRTYNMFKLQSEIRGEQTAFIDETLANQKLVKAFSQEERNADRFEEINGRLKKAALKATFFSSLTNPCTRFINNMIYAGVALTGALVALSGGGLSVGGLTCFLSYANQYTKPFNEISGVITELQSALACAARIFELTDDAPALEEPADPKPLPAVDGDVALEGVCFSYEPEQKLIEDLNLQIKPGQRVAIVGPTGCGKTTLINLLMRFYDVNRGKITVENTDIRTVTRHELRRHYGMVLQDTWIKEGTVRENIAMGKPEASEEEIIAAAKASHAHSFIKRLPQGYDTPLKADGGSLSQGQKQLLCIARIMLTLPPMLILDEATSSIDTRTELKIQDAFAKMMKGRTCFIVAHRLSTIRDADVILVMKDGHIIEQGNHETLLQQNGFYATLYNSQFSH
ncbi:MAG: ABC transporter ATP-binding protein [Clostridia bacterium]|nr:ABC transporter ATP-binding protein [Clostridia bacterium]